MAVTTDVALERYGGRVSMTTSLDPAHPAENMIDGKANTYWMSTGLYPQEIVLQLSCPSSILGARVATTRVRGLRLEGCDENKPISFKTLAETELQDLGGELQVRELRCEQQQGLVEYVRLVILSGWGDFCSVHRIHVDAAPADPGRSPSKASVAGGPSSLAQRRSSKLGLVGAEPALPENLEVSIPIPAGNSVAPRPDTLSSMGNTSPTAPRVLDAQPWGDLSPKKP